MPAIDTVAGESLTEVGAPKSFVPLRADPFGGLGDADSLDAKRLELVHGSWTQLDDVMRPFIRQVEENVRMLAGQQHTVYHPSLGQWIDIGSWLPSEGQRWRKRPTVNLLLPWYVITHARCTENPPIVTFVPGPDQIDAELAETMDTALKTLWRELGMVDVNDQLFMWVIVAGRGYLQTRLDPTGGPLRPWVANEAGLLVLDEFEQPIIDPNTGEPVREMIQGEDIPLDAKGEPLAVLAPEGIRILGEPHQERAGTLRCDVVSPLNVRGSWGPEPWYRKGVHQTRMYHTPEEFYDLYGAEVEPDLRGDAANEVMETDRILYGSGFYNAVSGGLAEQSAVTRVNELIEVTARIQRPCHYGGMEETEESPGGRMTVATRKRVIYDGPRPAKFPYTSPIHAFDFLRLPGRPNGTSSQEAMNPLVKYNNSLLAREMEHINLLTNPKWVADAASGLRARDITNEPGVGHVANRRPGVPALEWIQAPRLGDEVFKMHAQMQGYFDQLGNLRGTEGEIPSPSASGELVKELRFNTDRFLGSTMRRAVEEYGRMIETWMSLLPIVWDQETILHYAGEDNVARTITVMPEMFEVGKINVVPDVESMLPEGRGERQARALQMVREQLITPDQYFEVAHFPHMSRLAKPGGIDRTTAEQENGALARADELPDEAAMIPVYEWYDHAVHLMIHERFMKSPAFVRASVNVQNAFVRHRMAHMMILAQQQADAMAAEAAAAGVEPGAQEKSGPPQRKPRSGGPDVPIAGPPLAPGAPEPPNSIFPARYPTALSSPPGVS